MSAADDHDVHATPLSQLSLNHLGQQQRPMAQLQPQPQVQTRADHKALAVPSYQDILNDLQKPARPETPHQPPPPREQYQGPPEYPTTNVPPPTPPTPPTPYTQYVPFPVYPQQPLVQPVQPVVTQPDRKVKHKGTTLHPAATYGIVFVTILAAIFAASRLVHKIPGVPPYAVFAGIAAVSTGLIYQAAS